MITLQYKSSKGVVVDLITQDGLVKVTDACFHSWGYKFDTTEKQFGVVVNKTMKDPVEYEATLMIRGIGNEAKQKLDELNSLFETDIVLNKTGKLIWNGWEIDCFIYESSTNPVEDYFGVSKSIKIYCPGSFWNKSIERSFEASGTTTTDGLNFPFNFPFNLGLVSVNEVVWNTGITIPSDFVISFLGNAIGNVLNPSITINGYEYKVFTTIQPNQQVDIKSATHEVIRYLSDGTHENIFNSRQFTPSVFKKIPDGQLTITWNGGFNFGITVYDTRSEPRWT